MNHSMNTFPALRFFSTVVLCTFVGNTLAPIARAAAPEYYYGNVTYAEYQADLTCDCGNGVVFKTDTLLRSKKGAIAARIDVITAANGTNCQGKISGKEIYTNSYKAVKFRDLKNATADDLCGDFNLAPDMIQGKAQGEAGYDDGQFEELLSAAKRAPKTPTNTDDEDKSAAANANDDGNFGAVVQNTSGAPLAQGYLIGDYVVFTKEYKFKDPVTGKEKKFKKDQIGIITGGAGNEQVMVTVTKMKIGGGARPWFALAGLMLLSMTPFAAVLLIPSVSQKIGQAAQPASETEGAVPIGVLRSLDPEIDFKRK